MDSFVPLTSTGRSARPLAGDSGSRIKPRRVQTSAISGTDRDCEALLAELQETKRRLAAATQRAERFAHDMRRWAAQLDAVIENAPARLALLDRDFNMVVVNSAFATAAGATEDRLVGRSYSSLFRDPLIAYMLEKARDLGSVQETHEHELTRWVRAGQECFVNICVTPITGEDGAVETVLLSMQDVTPQVKERKQAEVVAAELDLTISSIADGVMIFDAEGELLRINPAGRKIVGLPQDESTKSLAPWMAHLSFESINGGVLDPDSRPGHRARRGETVAGELMAIRRPDGEVTWVAVSQAPLEISHGSAPGAVVAFTDLTAVRSVQERQDDIIRALSHDLRSPLTVVQGHAQVLLIALTASRSNPRRRKSAEAIVMAAKQMNSMIMDLVDSARMEAGDLTLNVDQLDLPSVLGPLKEQLAGVLETERLTLEIEGPIPPVLADRDRVERIAVNLISNALKYSNPESEVTLKVCTRDGAVVVSVMDRGEGIPPEELSTLFQRYGRTCRSRRRQDSLGLGLFITRGLVEAQGGRVWAESEVGKGSTFSFLLRAYEPGQEVKLPPETS